MNVTKQFERLGITGCHSWAVDEQSRLFGALQPFINALGGEAGFRRIFDSLEFEQAETGNALALAYKDKIKLNISVRFSTWSVAHELAHVWDARNQWGLSLAMQKYTGGFTSKRLSRVIRYLPFLWDAEGSSAGKTSGRFGRKPGCNAFGYFYGDKPSGSNWSFNHKEDFAESVVMYCGWNRGNALSRIAHGRINRYLLGNGEKDPIYGIVDHWSYYKKYFYPRGGDYTQTKRWQFVDDLIQNL